MKQLLITCAFLINSFSMKAGMHDQKDQTMSEIPETIHASYAINIDAPAEYIFPLTCPVREYDWINGWKCKLEYCPNGYAEEGIVFSEIMSAPILMGRHYGKTSWTALKSNTAEYQRIYQLENEISKTLLKIEMFPRENGKTKVVFDMTYTARSEKARALMQSKLDKKLTFLMSMLGKMLKYYCENNSMIPTRDLMKFSQNTDLFTSREKHKMILNKIAMLLSSDKNRRRYLKGKEISVK